MANDDKVLFEIHESHLNTGLRGFPVGTCRTSAVDPEKGVSYGGYPILELAGMPSENAIHLLLRKHLPDESEGKAFRKELFDRGTVSPEVFDLLSRLPKSAHPMEWFVAGLLYLGMTGKKNDYVEDGLNLVARASAVAAAIFRFREGWGDPIAPRADLGYAENFAHMLGCPTAHKELPGLLRLFHVLHMDHGGGNLSTFTGKAVASGLSDAFISMSAAMSALYGPLHGRANQECLQFVKEVGTSDEQAVAEFVRKRLAEGGKIFGFGHAVLRAEDPRAKVQYAFGKEHFPDHPLVKTVLALRKVVPPILKEQGKAHNPYPNVDAVSGTLLSAGGLDKPEYYTLLFGWSRVVGISAQIIDERTVLREGKGVPIYRPRFIAEQQPEHHLQG